MYVRYRVLNPETSLALVEKWESAMDFQTEPCRFVMSAYVTYRRSGS
jgi:hypothetical protein